VRGGFASPHTPLPACGGQAAWRNTHGPPAAGGQQTGWWGGPAALHSSPPEGARVTPAHMNIASPRGVWGNPVSPYPHPVGGFGRAAPSQEQLYFHRGVVRRSRMEGSYEHRLSERGVGKPGFCPPTRGRCGEGAALTPGDGETGFPYLLPQWEGVGGRRPRTTFVPPAGVRRRMDNRHGEATPGPTAAQARRAGRGGERCGIIGTFACS